MIILVAHSDASVRHALTQYLFEAACSPIPASNGLAALRIAEMTMPPVIFVEALLPEVNGFAVARYVRTIRASYRPRVVVVTEAESLDTDMLRKRYGINRVMTKPISREKLLRALGSKKERERILAWIMAA